MLYVDLEKAFGHVIRELLLGFPSWIAEDYESRLEHLRGLGLNQSTVQFVLNVILTKGPIFQQFGVEDALVNLLRNLHDGSWFEIAGAQSVVTARTGGRDP